MKESLQVVRGSLQREFQWLQKNYPLRHFPHVTLRTYPAASFVGEGAEKDGFLLYDWEKGEECTILLILEETLAPSLADTLVMDTFCVEGDHLYFYMLYHEYGHLVAMNTAVEERGYDTAKREMEKRAEDVEAIWEAVEGGNCSEEDGQRAYRQLPAEKEADDFASKVYERRKGILSLPVRVITKKGGGKV